MNSLNKLDVYMNIQEGNLNPENIIKILNEIKSTNWTANLKRDKYIYWDIGYFAATQIYLDFYI